MMSQIVVRRVYLAKFSYWSKFYVNIVAGSGLMTIFVYKGLTRIRKSEIHLSFAQYLETMASWGYQAWHEYSNKMLLNAAKCQGYNFYCF